MSSSPLPPESKTEALRSLGYSVRRCYVDEFHRREVGRLTEGSLVLDLGGTKTDKRGSFDIAECPVRVICANIARDKAPDLQADAVHLPIREESMDALICSELLEHVPQPEEVLKEAWRVLRPGGTLLITAPFMFHIHGDPTDHTRFTDHHWRLLLKQIGFTHVDIESQGSLPTTLLDMLRQWGQHAIASGRLGRLRRWLVRRFLDRLTRTAFSMECKPAVRDSAFHRSYTTGFGIVARRR